MITYKYLDEIPIEQIHECQVESFKDYAIDMSYMTLDVMTKRTKLGRVKFDYSVGAFDENKLVGFILVAIDLYNECEMAFDDGTGIIKEYRGQGIAGGMFQHALVKLKKRGITKFMLEVLQENSAAIRAYQKEGFEIKRNLNCYSLDIKNFHSGIDSLPGITIKSLTQKQVGKYFHFVDYELSWEQMYEAIQCINDEIVIDGAFDKDECIGFIVYYPTTDWVFVIAIKEEYQNQKVDLLLLTQLVSKIKSTRPEIYVDNIPPDYRLCEMLESIGFKLFAKQYEMVAEI